MRKREKTSMANKIEIFISYEPGDKPLFEMVLKVLDSRLKPLEQQGLVSIWHRHKLLPGAETAPEIAKHLQSARIHLLLISADFMASDFCFSDEMRSLIRRHKSGEIQVIPVILRSIYWKEAPFGGLEPLPEKGKPLTSWNDKDEGLFSIAEGVRAVVDAFLVHDVPKNTSSEGKTMTHALFTNGFALLIGVGADLPATVKDATALHDVLVHPAQAAYPTTQVELLTETSANRQKILAAFDRLIQHTKQNPDATVLVYFSGHGGTIKRSGKPADYFLVPHGYDATCRGDTAISGKEFTEKIEAVQARKLVVFLDCCHAGGIPLLKDVPETFEKSPLPPDLITALERGSGRIVIASSDANEVSYTGTPYSVFTACLLEALAGKGARKQDGFARIFDVLSYLFDQVPSRTSDRQHPFINKALNLNDNFPLCYYAGGSKDVPGELPVSPPPSPPTSLTAGKRRRLEERRKEIQVEWDVRSEKTQRIRAALAIENDPATIFKYEKQILQEHAIVTQLSDELDTIEQELQ